MCTNSELTVGMPILLLLKQAPPTNNGLVSTGSGKAVFFGSTENFMEKKEHGVGENANSPTRTEHNQRALIAVVGRRKWEA